MKKVRIKAEQQFWKIHQSKVAKENNQNERKNGVRQNQYKLSQKLSK